MPGSRRWRRFRPAYVLGAAVALTVTIMVVGAPGPWPQGHAAATTVGVGTGGDAFGPAAVTIAQGDSVTWQWQSGNHTVTSATASEPFDSGSMTSGAFSHTFATAGTFSYLCIYHGGMTGTITVTPTAAAPAAPAAGTAPGAAPAGAPGTRPASGPTPVAAGAVPKLVRVKRLVFTLNHPATVATVAAGKKTQLGKLEAKTGKGTMLLALNRLKVGRYTLLVNARNTAGRATRIKVHVKVTWALRYRALAALRAAAKKAAPAPAAAVPALPPTAGVSAPARPAPAATPVPAAPPTTATPCDDDDHSGHGHGGDGCPDDSKDGG
jgi:plastocyanin